MVRQEFHEYQTPNVKSHGNIEPEATSRLVLLRDRGTHGECRLRNQPGGRAILRYIKDAGFWIDREG